MQNKTNDHPCCTEFVNFKGGCTGFQMPVRGISVTGGAVAQWSERRSGDRGVPNSNPAGPLRSELWQFRLHLFASVFRRRH